MKGVISNTYIILATLAFPRVLYRITPQTRITPTPTQEPELIH